MTLPSGRYLKTPIKLLSIRKLLTLFSEFVMADADVLQWGNAYSFRDTVLCRLWCETLSGKSQRLDT